MMEASTHCGLPPAKALNYHVAPAGGSCHSSQLSPQPWLSTISTLFLPRVVRPWQLSALGAGVLSLFSIWCVCM